MGRRFGGAAGGEHHVSASREALHEPLPKVLGRGDRFEPIAAVTHEEWLSQQKGQQHSDGSDIPGYGSMDSVGP
jgi:hypothetical protein